MPDLNDVKVIVFDTFGTVVDWRGSIIKDLSAWGGAKGIEQDWSEFADAWRDKYNPQKARVIAGKRMKGRGRQRRNDGSGAVIALFGPRFPPILLEQHGRRHPRASDMAGPALMCGVQQLHQCLDLHCWHVAQHDQHTVGLPCFGMAAGCSKRHGHAPSRVDTDEMEVGGQQIGHGLGRDNRRQFVATCVGKRSSRRQNQRFTLPAGQ